VFRNVEQREVALICTGIKSDLEIKKKKNFSKASERRRISITPYEGRRVCSLEHGKHLGVEKHAARCLKCNDSSTPPSKNKSDVMASSRMKGGGAEIAWRKA